MKQRISHFIGTTLLCSILAMNVIMAPKISLAAQESNPDGIITLEKNTLYKYDLNGDDKVDEIKFKLTSGEEKSTLKLYINNKLCLTRKNAGYSYGVQVCDLDENDNYLDLYVYDRVESDCTVDALFARYNGKALDSKVAFNPAEILKNMNAYRYDLVKLAGNGKFYILNDTPVFSDAIGCYTCYMPFQLKDNAITGVPAKTYKLHKGSSSYKYEAAKNFPAYEKAGSKKVVYTVKKGNKVTFDKLYISKSGKVYFRMINSKGKAGWIKSDQKDLFVLCPMWG